MSFGLKNTKTTYERAMTDIVHDMLHDCLKDYVDDIVVNSKEVHKCVNDLRRVFKRCKQHKLK